MQEYHRAFHALNLVSHGVMQDTKGVSHLLNPVCPATGLVVKGTRSSVAAPHPFEIPLLAFLSGEFLAPALPDAAVARVVSDCVGRFRLFSHSYLFEVLCAL